MRILVGWDNPEQAELIGLYLGNEHAATTAVERGELVRQATLNGPWDVLLYSIEFGGGGDEAFAVFEELRTKLPTAPIVGACPSDEVVRVARYISAGMQSFVLCDAGGDFVFLLLPTLENSVRAVQAERERQVAAKLRDEVQAVRRFEQAIIGDSVISPPGYTAAAKYESSEIRISGGEVLVLAGGDFYDVFEIDRTRTGIVIADAAGHGMQACLAVAVLQTHLQMLQEGRIRTAGELVAELNRRFCSHRIVRNQGNLATLLFGVLRTDRHELTWAAAGHPPPLLHDRAAQSIETLAPNNSNGCGPPLGVDPDVHYHDTTHRIPPAARLLFYTDGLTEAMPELNSGEQFGQDGVRGTLRRVADRTAVDALHALLNDSHAFTRGQGRHDDASVLILDRVL